MKVYTIGGYEKVGKNMTAVEVNDEIVIFDMGVDMEEVVEHEGEMEDLTTAESLEEGIVPEDKQIMQQKDKVKAIVLSHGHLDHTAAVPKLAGTYDAPIVATPYTLKIVKRLIREDKKNINNELISMDAGNTLSLSPNLELEFVNMTHSIPGTVTPVLNTTEGKIVYALDFKLDDEPTFGQKPDYERLVELSEESVKALITDSTRVSETGTTSSEKEAQVKLKHTLNRAYSIGGGVVVTTFSSHIARLNNILRVNNGRRQVVMLGRSLKEYTSAAERMGYIDLSDVEVVSRRNAMEKLLKKIQKDKEDYLVVCTGNQGEKRAVLSRLARDETPYNLNPGDHVIFSSSTIPTPITRANKYALLKKLREKNIRYYEDIHSHGHGKREDQRDFVRMVDPEYVIPAHGGTDKLASCASLAREEGYVIGETALISQNGRCLQLS